MTMIMVVIVGLGSLLVISALENSTLVDTFTSIMHGDGLPQATPESTIAGSANGNTLAYQQGTGNFSWLGFKQTQQYGQHLTGVVNTGIDLATPFHTPITSLTDGTVVSTTYSPEIGGQALIEFNYFGKTMYAAYVHLDDILVSVGQHIPQGAVIGLSGGQLSGGLHNAKYPYSTGPHTLFGIFKAPSASYENSIDPTPFFTRMIQTLLASRGMTV